MTLDQLAQAADDAVSIAGDKRKEPASLPAQEGMEISATGAPNKAPKTQTRTRIYKLTYLLTLLNYVDVDSTPQPSIGWWRVDNCSLLKLVREGQFYPPCSSCLPAVCTTQQLNSYMLVFPSYYRNYLSRLPTPTSHPTHTNNERITSRTESSLHAAALDSKHTLKATRKVFRIAIPTVSRSYRVVRITSSSELCLLFKNSTRNSNGDHFSMTHSHPAAPMIHNYPPPRWHLHAAANLPPFACTHLHPQASQNRRRIHYTTRRR